MVQKTKDREIELIMAQIRQSKKYRAMDICEETIRHLLTTELKRRNKKDAIHAARAKLHHIVAPYLGEPDYDTALSDLRRAFSLNCDSEIKNTCAQIMMAHTSTRERLVIQDEFYPSLFAVTGPPTALLDIACGLNPLCFPWMGLPTSTRYYAYDLNRRRVEFLNQFFLLRGLSGGVRAQDVLLDIPKEEATLALILKEVPRFEKRQRGCSLPLLDALRVRYLIVSVPTKNLTGRHRLTDPYRNLLHNIVKQSPWRISELTFKNELVFCIDKGSPVASQ